MMVLWLLDPARHFASNFATILRAPVWTPLLGLSFSAVPARCSRSFLVRRSRTWFAVFRWTPAATSSSLCGRILRLGEETGILDWYTILVGVLALCAVVMHGSLWVQLKTTGPVNARAAVLARRTSWLAIVLTVLVTAITFYVQPQIKANFTTWPWGLLFPFLAVAGIAGVQFEIIKRDEQKAFFASCAYLTGMLTSVVFGLYPMVLPARNPIYSLTVTSAKAPNYGLKIGVVWWVIGMTLAAGYFTFLYRSFGGKVAVETDGHGD